MINLANLTELNVGEELGEGGIVIEKSDDIIQLIDKYREKYYLVFYEIKRGSLKLKKWEKITRKKYIQYKSQITK